MADLLVLLTPAESLQNGAASAEKLEHTGPAKKKTVALVQQRKQLASTPEQSLPKRTEPSVQSTTS